MTEANGLPPGVTVFERGWLSSNNILFVGPEGNALVDSGYVTHAAQTLALVDDALAGRPLHRLLNTHLHSDHCGGNAALQARYAFLRTAIPPGEAELVARWDETALSFLSTGQQCPRFRYDDLLVPGSVCELGGRAWEVHGAPGHDPHSVILFEPSSRTLISADALWENGFGVAFPELAGEPSFEEVGATLQHIAGLAPLQVIPGHGRPFRDVRDALGRAFQRLEGLQRHPAKHARHAMKVLIKFKLLEAQSLSMADWVAWTRATPYLERIRARFFADADLELLCRSLLNELIASGAAGIDNETVLNR